MRAAPIAAGCIGRIPDDDRDRFAEARTMRRTKPPDMRALS
jgi:hypothetical protein